METAVECTHCRVVMTSWSAPGSPIRYYQCPFCARTHSSLYGEVFRRRAGARLVDAPVRPARRAAGAPMATAEDIRWAALKATAARWFARLEAEEHRAPSVRPARAVPARPRPQALVVAADDGIPELDPDEVIEISPGRRARGR